MIHRAILGSLERFIAIITENFAGKWPFWLNPKQVMVIPVAMKYAEYANSVAQKFKDAGLFAEVDESANTLNKMIRNAQVGQWSFVMGMSSPFPLFPFSLFLYYVTPSFSFRPHIFGRMNEANN
jgi:threonyl-tRNA synthetase